MVRKETSGGSEDSSTVVNFGGPLGADSGMNFGIQMRDLEDGTNPWLVHVTKSLGTGATLIMEHGNKDSGSSSDTALYLQVDF